MLTHVAITLRKLPLYPSLTRQGAPTQFGPCISLAVRRRELSAVGFRAFAIVTYQQSPSSGIKNSTSAPQPLPSVSTAETSEKKSLSSSGRDFLKFAFKLHGVNLPKESAPAAGKREKDAEAQARGFLPLAPLPEPPKYPCPYLSEEEISQYLSPLYDQGWRIGSSHFSLPKHVASDVKQAPELAKEFVFVPEHGEAGLVFVEAIEKVQNQENHHCTVVVDGSCVHVRTHTHSARPLVSIEATKDTKGKRVDLPGVTLRDVRLATLVEEAFRPFLTSGTARWHSQLPNSRAVVRPLSTQGIERLRFIGGRKNMSVREPACPVCGGGHRGPDCPHKHDIAPHMPCHKCGKMHWRFMCDA